MTFSQYDLTAPKPVRRPVVLEGEIARLSRDAHRPEPSRSPEILHRLAAGIRAFLSTLGAHTEQHAAPRLTLW